MILLWGKLCIIKLTIVGEININFVKNFLTFRFFLVISYFTWLNVLWGFIDVNYIMGLVIHCWGKNSWGGGKLTFIWGKNLEIFHFFLLYMAQCFGGFIDSK